MGLRKGTGGGDLIAVAAHLDTVFPEGTDVKVKREDTRLSAPGIGDDTRSLAVLLAMGGAIGAITLDLGMHLQADLSSRADAWSATVAALVAWQGFHGLVLLVMGSYVLARSWAGRLRPDARATLDNTALMWHGTVGQALAGMALVRLLPAWMGG